MITLPLTFFMAFSVAMLAAVTLSYGLSVVALVDYVLDLAELRRPSCRARLGVVGWQRARVQTLGYIGLECLQMAVVAAFLVVGETDSDHTFNTVTWVAVIQNLVLFVAILGQSASTAIRRYIRHRAHVRQSQ